MDDLLTHRYAYKIKTAEEVRAAVGPYPRQRSVVMCHGVFDLVHPGHIRHLIYAKGKADLLVVSITSDTHISKSPHRPFVPQQLRALNLAALEVVDFVVIDDHPTPIENIAVLQPDFFAKGYEYGAGGKVNPKTTEEIEALHAYGGEILFTPGDFVYSSSALINDSPPNLAVDKLLTLMHAEDISFSDLYASIDKLSDLSVHVVGDTIVDGLTYTTMIGGGTKTPTLSVRFDHRDDFVGGAGIVAKHLRAGGARVTFTTVLGVDDYKDFVLEDLSQAGIDCRPVIDRARPTTQKNAFVCGGYRLLKVDTVDNRVISDKVLTKIARHVSETPAQGVVFSDFRHGIFNRLTIPRLIAAIPQGVFRVADSQVASRWGNILDFKGFDIVTPNEREARFALADQDTGIRPLAARLLREAEAKLVILKLGDRGSLTCRSNDEVDVRSFFVVDSFVNQVVDPVGAGDALLAYATLGKMATGSEVIAAILGSIAAALECEVDGNTPVTTEHIHKRIKELETRAQHGG